MIQNLRKRNTLLLTATLVELVASLLYLYFTIVQAGIESDRWEVSDLHRMISFLCFFVAIVFSIKGLIVFILGLICKPEKNTSSSKFASVLMLCLCSVLTIFNLFFIFFYEILVHIAVYLWSFWS